MFQKNPFNWVWIVLFAVTSAQADANPTMKAPPGTPPAKLTSADRHELLLNTTENIFRISNGASFVVGAGYRYLIDPQKLLQIGYSSGLDIRFANGSTFLSSSHLGAFRMNFSETHQLREAWFAEAELGFDLRRRSNSLGSIGTANFAYGIAGGKRIRVFQSITYSPSARLFKVVGSDMEVTLTPLAISVFF